MTRPDTDLRLKRAERKQIGFEVTDLDSLVEPDHPVRAICAVVEKLDLATFYRGIASERGHAGAPAVDPKIKLCLWVYATSKGVSSARAIAELCQRHVVYRWICGGVPVAYRTLSDFRVEHGVGFSVLLTQVIALLLRHGLVSLERIAQDGSRIRASAGAGSFHRALTLDASLVEARAHVDAVLADGEGGARRRAAKVRAANDRLARIEQAVAEVPSVVETKKRSGAKDKTPRASTTEPEARVMKMGDGGFRPAHNVQFAATTDDANVIVGVSVTNVGSDAGQLIPMLEQVRERTGRLPNDVLVDGGFPSFDAIDKATAMGVTVYAPVPKPRKEGVDPHAPKPDDSPAVATWRQRMATDEAKAIYKTRGAAIERVNADAKQHRGLDSFTVRGLEKVTGSVCLFALTYDILRLVSIAP